MIWGGGGGGVVRLVYMWNSRRCGKILADVGMVKTYPKCVEASKCWPGCMDCPSLIVPEVLCVLVYTIEMYNY